MNGITSKSLLTELSWFEPRNQYQQKKIKILLRDKGICQLCKREITSISSFNLDHIIPSSLGGGSGYDNLQATHRKCNGLKGNRIDLPPSYFVNHKPKNKLKIEVQEDKVIDINTDHCAELYNEIQRHGTTRLSYKMFKEYFEKYHLTQVIKSNL